MVGLESPKVTLTGVILLLAMVATRAMTPLEAVNMVKVAQMEKSIDGQEEPLSNTLMKIMDDTKRMIVSSPNTKQTAQEFAHKVKQAVRASGIELVLPLDCGRNPRNSRTPLADEDGSSPLPWIAALGTSVDGLFYFQCTGAIISEYHIITDGNCAMSPTINVVQLNVTSVPGRGHLVQNFVKGRRIHPSIKTKEDLYRGTNIGLLELAYPLTFNDYVQPVCLPGIFEDDREKDLTFNVTLIGFSSIVDVGEGMRSGSLSLIHEAVAQTSALCDVLIRRDINKDEKLRDSNLHTVLTKDHLCVIKNFEKTGQTLAFHEKTFDSGQQRVVLVGVGGIANAQQPLPIAFTRTQSQRFWIDLVIKKFVENTMKKF